MKYVSLNKLYAKYLAGDLERKDFEGLMYKYLVNNQELTCLSHWENDEYSDFLSWFYPRLRRSVDSYKDVGASFEAFMNKHLLISSKEYRVRTVTKAVTEYSAWSVRIPDMYAYEETPVYIHKNTESSINKLIIDRKGRKNTRRILALVLKCYYFISEDFAEKIAPIIGMSYADLIDMINKLRKIRKKRDDEIYYLKERVYCQFYRCIIYDKRLTLMRENTTAQIKLKQRLEKARHRLEKMRQRIAAVRTEATNQQVADVIGIKKGTVDSSLYQLKSRWNKMSKKALLN